LRHGLGRDPQADAPLVTNGDVELKRIDFEAYMDRVPEKLRAEFRADSERVKKTVDGLVGAAHGCAERARKAGSPRTRHRRSKIRQARTRCWSRPCMLQVEKDMKYPELLARAREIYQTRSADYKTEGRVHVEHILVDMKCRTHDAALKRAQEIRAEVASGRKDFKAYAKEGERRSLARQELRRPRPCMLPGTSSTSSSARASRRSSLAKSASPSRRAFGFHVVRLGKARARPPEDLRGGARRKSSPPRSASSRRGRALRSWRPCGPTRTTTSTWKTSRR
jgi:hypothetical protein